MPSSRTSTASCPPIVGRNRTKHCSFSDIHTLFSSNLMCVRRFAVDNLSLIHIYHGTCLNCHCEAPKGPWRPEREARGSALGVQSREGSCDFADGFPIIRHVPRDCHVGLRPPRNDKSGGLAPEAMPVSYTHLDVYKRQPCISRAVSCRCCDDENSCGRRRAPAG